MLLYVWLILLIVSLPFFALAQATSQPALDPSALMKLAESPLSVLVFSVASLLLTRIFNAGLGEKLPKVVWPWVSMVLGISGLMVTAFAAGADWRKALLYGVAAGGLGSWSYSAGVNALPGVKAKTPPKDGGSIRAALLCFMAAAGLACILGSLGGCTWAWQKRARVSLTASESALQVSDKSGLDYYQRTCRALAKKCPAGSSNETCAPLGECWGKRRLLQNVLDKAALTIAGAWASCVAEDQEGTDAKLAVLKSTMGQLGKLMTSIMPGVLP